MTKIKIKYYSENAFGVINKAKNGIIDPIPAASSKPENIENKISKVKFPLDFLSSIFIKLIKERYMLELLSIY